MAYSFQTFTLSQILTAAQMNQVEVNIRDHEHGVAGVSGDVPNTAATQANQETASSLVTIVTPGTQHFHPSALKGWVKATIGGVATVSYNVTSVTDVTVRIITVNWGTDFSSANYVAGGTLELALAASNPLVIRGTTNAPTAGTTQFANAAGAADPTNWHLWAMGDQ
ncbi:MAG: hypothetical protein U1E51_36330 [Candidatus Binatia bacterium]|nr:hypothetical protein [Candidatus Binatia bacterium]